MIYDTTLRDGEQTPGVSFAVEAKLKIARMLDELGVPQIEAGFPVVSKEEWQAVRAIASEGLNAKVLCLARSMKSDIDAALSCDVDGVIVFIALSLLHLKYKLKMPVSRAIELALDAVEYAKDHGLFVQLSAEDATRTPLTRLYRLFKRAEEVSVDRAGIADTTGCITPTGMHRLISLLKQKLKVKLSVHCHNDFGLATANSLAAYEAGVDAISVTVNGIGERCGNAALEEVVTALYCLYGVDLGFKLHLLKPLSDMVVALSGVKRDPFKPIVGEHAFKHESGIHVAAVLKEPYTYEPYDPSLVGNRRAIVFGKHSGITGIREILKRKGIVLSEAESRVLLDRVKRISKGYLTEEQLTMLALREVATIQ